MRFLIVFFLACSLLVPITTFAQANAPGTVPLTNPIGGKKDSPEGQTNINALVGIGIKQVLGVVGSITFAVFVYGGFLWLTSAGNSDQVKKGSETMLWAGIGVCIIFASYAILQFVITALSS